LELLPQYVAPQLFAFSAAALKFPFFLSVLFLYLGSAAGSIAGFEIGKHYKETLAGTFFSKKLVDKIKKGINGKGRIYLIISAVCPVPFIPFLFGLLHLNRKNFLFFGVLPRFIYFFYVGLAAFYIF
tara:strand:- start:350 stop:730 length:381 start_codon:yes stop_codon:yes gene_type:complete